VVERALHEGRVSLPTFFADEAFSAPSQVTLGEDAAHHMRVRRLDIGARVRLLDGQGTRGEGVLTQLAKRHAAVSVESAEFSEPPAPVHLLLPVADKDRMLWLAEKATELGVASWRPVLYRRSKHVNPRGEGPVFQQKLRARMISALEQSGGSWLPTMYPDASVEHAISAKPDGIALVLDAGAPSVLEVLRAADLTAGVTVAIGPEGGFEAAERSALESAGFLPAAIGQSVLRFETAAVSAIAIARAALA
jgi:16S rRNA (uracil1498-N3)-methyltransferase